MYYEKAKELLEEQAKKVTTGNAGVIAPYVKETLLQFAKAEPEFAQAIVQSTGTFSECCEKCTKGITKSHCSDKDVYQAAAEYYFPGSKVKFEMTIDLIGDAANPEPIVIDFTDFC